MKRSCILFGFLFLAVFIFSQQNSLPRIIGGFPFPDDGNLYQIQVGAYKIPQNAERASLGLIRVSLNPVYEQYMDFTRVMVKGVNYREIPLVLEKIKALGYSEVIIRVDTAIAELPVSDAVLPVGELREIANRTVKMGETKSLADLAADREVTSWISSTPSTVQVDPNGNVTGFTIGNGYIQINEQEYISVAVVPREDFYIVPEYQAAMLPRESRVGNSSSTRVTEYRTEPTFRLAYRFNNKGENRGASGRNGGIDILGRGADYEWLWTTYRQGGWFYNLNGEIREMVDGYQKSANGVELTVKPEFVYDRGVPYLQLRHILHNTNNFPVTDQRFGASADVMIHQNDYASLIYTPYGAYMTDSERDPSLELMFIGTSGEGITPVDTLWLGTWDGGAHLNHIYDDARSDVHFSDSAIGFSYQNIDLVPGETREYIVRFTLARNGD